VAFVFIQLIEIARTSPIFRLIATPGRLLHLVVEMNLDLRSIQYVVFDEADR
jgi:superfamily II DNA/RNA helicase